MQSTNSHRVETEVGVRYASVARWTLGAAALSLWVAVGSYAWLRSTLAPRYTVGLVGAAVGLALLASLLAESPDDNSAIATAGGEESRLDRLVVAGCLLAVGVGTLGVWGSVDQVAASQPQPSTAGVAAGGLLVCGLVVLIGRRAPVAAGLAIVAVGGSAATAPTVAIIETMVFDGLYGPLTQAAATWVAPGCLLAGLWRTTGTDRRLAAMAGWVDPTSSGDGWPFDQQLAAVGCIAVLVWWQTGSTGPLAAAGVAVTLVGVGLGSAEVWTSDSRPADRKTLVDRLSRTDWRGPLLVAGGPLAVLAVLGVGFRLPVGTVLVAACLCCLGCCLVRPTVVGEPRETAVRSGIRTALDGSIVGVWLLGRVVVPLAVAGGVVAVLDATGISLRVLSSVVWLSGGSWLAAVVVVGGGCLVAGRLLPVLAAYALAALVGVPILQLLAPLFPLIAHVVVVFGVVGGWLLADPAKL